MKLVEIEKTEPSGYIYHASQLPMTARSMHSILARGLVPSKSGYSGPGVYFAREPAGCYAHVSQEDSIMFRARWDDLVRLYGKFRDNRTGIQWDNDEIIVPGKVPANILEVEFFQDEWWPIDQAYTSLTDR